MKNSILESRRQLNFAIISLGFSSFLRSSNKSFLDDTKRIQLSLKAGQPLYLNRVYYINEDIVIPSNSIIYGKGVFKSLKNIKIILQGTNIYIKGVTFDFSKGGTIIGKNLKNIFFLQCNFNNSSNSSGIILKKSKNIYFKNCSANYNIKKGIYLVEVENTHILKGTYSFNKHFGLFVSQGKNIKIIKNKAFKNGLNKKFSGIVGTRIENLISQANITYENEEHGESYQGVNNFIIDNFVSYKNGASGLCLQSDKILKDNQKLIIPSANGIIIRGESFLNKRNGIVIKEKNYNIKIIKNKCYKNSIGMRFVDIGQSKLKSINIFLKDNEIVNNRINYINSNKSIIKK